MCGAFQLACMSSACPNRSPKCATPSSLSHLSLTRVLFPVVPAGSCWCTQRSPRACWALPARRLMQQQQQQQQQEEEEEEEDKQQQEEEQAAVATRKEEEEEQQQQQEAAGRLQRAARRAAPAAL